MTQYSIDRLVPVITRRCVTVVLLMLNDECMGGHITLCMN